jgi:hypothetical protein
VVEATTNVNAVTTPVTAFLSQERGHTLGDTVALPLFFLHSFALRRIKVGAIRRSPKDGGS